jgi:hypothetical protein
MLPCAVMTSRHQVKSLTRLLLRMMLRHFTESGCPGSTENTVQPLQVVVIVTSGIISVTVTGVMRLLAVHQQVDTLDEAIDLVNANPYGNGTAIFTDSGAAARKFQHDVQVMLLMK